MAVNPLDYFNNIGDRLAGYIIGQNPSTGEIPSQMTYDNSGNLVEASPFVVPPVEEEDNFFIPNTSYAVSTPESYAVGNRDGKIIGAENNLNEIENPLMDLQTDIDPFELASGNFTANPVSTGMNLGNTDITPENPPISPSIEPDFEDEILDFDIDYNPYLNSNRSLGETNRSYSVQNPIKNLSSTSYAVGPTAGSTFTPEEDNSNENVRTFGFMPKYSRPLSNFITKTSESVDELKDKFPRLNNLLSLGGDNEMLMNMMSNIGSAEFDDKGKMTNPGTGLFGREGGFLSKFGTGQGALSGLSGISGIGNMLGEGLSNIGENLQDGGYQYANPFERR